MLDLFISSFHASANVYILWTFGIACRLEMSFSRKVFGSFKATLLLFVQLAHITEIVSSFGNM